MFSYQLGILLIVKFVLLHLYGFGRLHGSLYVNSKLPYNNIKFILLLYICLCF